MNAWPDRFDESIERDGLDADTTIGVRQEGKQDGGEILLGGQHVRAVRQRGRDQPAERRDLIADSDTIGGDADQGRELPACAVDDRVVVRGLGTSLPPDVEGFVDRLGDASRRQSDARGVDVHARGLEFFLRCLDGQQMTPPSECELDRATGPRRRSIYR